MVYNIYPGVDENFNFPPEINQAMDRTYGFTATRDKVDQIDRGLTGSLGWLTNKIADPKPVNPAETYNGARCTLSVSGGWGRATCNTVGATTFFGFANVTSGISNNDPRRRIPVKTGDKIYAEITLMAPATQRTSAFLFIHGWTHDGDGYTNQVTVASTDQIHIDAGKSREFVIEGVVPAGVTHVGNTVMFRPYGQTYPAVGDSIDFRNSMVVINPKSTPAYFDGDSSDAYWLGTPNASASQKASNASSGSGVKRSAIVDAGLKRRGRVIGTGGLPVVALRFDHHFEPFKTKILPVLQSLRLPWSQMINIGNLGTGNDTVTAAEINTMCQSGGELMNHSLTHSAVSNSSEADREITQSLIDLRAAFPNLWIDGWAGPGASEYMGLEGSDTPEKFFDTYPGKLILDQHAFVRGYYPGLYQPLVGDNLIGQSHATIDAQTDSWVDAVVRGAISDRAGVTLMLHPNYLDQTGYMTTAQMTAVLTSLANRRDNGEILVMSTTGILLADIDRDIQSLIDVPAAVIPTTEYTVSSRRYAQQLGVPHEVFMYAKSANTVRITVTVSTPRGDITKTHSETSNNQFKRVSVVVTPPNDATGIKIKVTPGSGNITHSGVKMTAI